MPITKLSTPNMLIWPSFSIPWINHLRIHIVIKSLRLYWSNLEAIQDNKNNERKKKPNSEPK